MFQGAFMSRVNKIKLSMAVTIHQKELEKFMLKHKVNKKGRKQYNYWKISAG